jgi:hypothetical protein
MVHDIMMNLNLDEAKALEAIRTIGLSNNGSIKLYPILYPIFTEFVNEIHKTLTLAKDRFNGKVNKVYLFNYDMHVGTFHQSLQTVLTVPVQTLSLEKIIQANPITQSFHNNLSAFIPVIAAHLR